MGTSAQDSHVGGLEDGDGDEAQDGSDVSPSRVTVCSYVHAHARRAVMGQQQMEDGRSKYHASWMDALESGRPMDGWPWSLAVLWGKGIAVG